MGTSSSEPQLQCPDKREDDRDNIAKPAGRTSGEDRQWGMCTIGCMYRVKVDSGYNDTAMAVEQRRQKKKQPATVRPRAATDPEPPPAGMPKQPAAAEGGRHRDCDAQCKRPGARPCWRAGKATYRKDPIHTA
jgi:hypothetical protein